MPEPTTHLSDLVPEGWEGACVVCGARMTAEDFGRGEAVALGRPGRVAVAHARHLLGTEEEYWRAVNALAAATALNLALQEEGF